MERISDKLAAEALQSAIGMLWPRYKALKVQYQRVKLDSLFSVIPMIGITRVTKTRQVLKAYDRASIPPFQPVIYTDSESNRRVAFGPIVDVGAKTVVLIDGLHRSVSAMQLGVEYVFAATITSDHAPPPVAKPMRLADVQISRSRKPLPPFFVGKGLPNFRPADLFTAAAEMYIIQKL